MKQLKDGRVVSAHILGVQFYHDGESMGAGYETGAHIVTPLSGHREEGVSTQLALFFIFRLGLYPTGRYHPCSWCLLQLKIS